MQSGIGVAHIVARQKFRRFYQLLGKLLSSIMRWHGFSGFFPRFSSELPPLFGERSLSIQQRLEGEHFLIFVGGDVRYFHIADGSCCPRRDSVPGQHRDKYAPLVLGIRGQDADPLYVPSFCQFVRGKPPIGEVVPMSR